MIIQNIDGNKTNFDAFNVKLDRISGKLNVIRLDETNVGKKLCTLFKRVQT